MSEVPTNLLLISDDQSLQERAQAILDTPDFNLTAKTTSITAMNGEAHPLATKNDVVIFDASEPDAATFKAAKELCDSRAPGAMMIALASDDLPLSKHRELMRSGADEVLPRETFETDILPQIDVWKSRRSAQLPTVWNGQASEGKIISVAEACGGLGTSTFAVNLADSLMARKRLFSKRPPANVIVVDLDFQFGTIAALLDVPETDAMWRMAMEGALPDATFVENAVVKSDCGLSVLTAPSRYGPLNALKPEQIKRLLDVLLKNYDYIVLDLPHALVDWIEPVLSRSDRLMLTTEVTVSSIRTTRKLMDFFLAENPKLDIRLVAMNEKKPFVLGSHHRAAVELLEHDFDHWIPCDKRAARAALDRGKPLSATAPRSALAKAINKIAAATRAVLPPRKVAFGNAE